MIHYAYLYESPFKYYISILGGWGVWGHAYFAYLGGVQNWGKPAYIKLACSLINSHVLFKTYIFIIYLLKIHWKKHINVYQVIWFLIHRFNENTIFCYWPSTIVYLYKNTPFHCLSNIIVVLYIQQNLQSFMVNDYISFIPDIIIIFIPKIHKKKGILSNNLHN